MSQRFYFLKGLSNLALSGVRGTMDSLFGTSSLPLSLQKKENKKTQCRRTDIDHNQADMTNQTICELDNTIYQALRISFLIAQVVDRICFMLVIVELLWTSLSVYITYKNLGQKFFGVFLPLHGQVSAFWPVLNGFMNFSQLGKL